MLHRSLLALTPLLGLLWSAASLACDVPGYASLIGADEHLAQARDVSLARVVRATPVGEGKFAFEFEVVRRILGPKRETFTVIGEASPQRVDTGQTPGHGAKLFAHIRSGRLRNDPACHIRPDFAVGRTYLAFLDQPITHLSFEEIPVVDGKPAPGDDWLAYVEARLVGPGRR